MESFLNKPEVNAGATVIADYFGPMDGGVCSGMVKTGFGNMSFAVVVQRGRYRCTSFLPWDCADPIQLMQIIMEDIEDECKDACLVSKPPEERAPMARGDGDGDGGC
ncbi:hypothetical protein EYF80_052135 [Liparis tanakae]|uniref:Uncharacterized protein n=1 Tax=Liparis tanakae TaxID=230148 RepID=A0A4Z2FA95_9TELE|nr:hypothetical protein EYF80_052135 [Liparis tanakae]